MRGAFSAFCCTWLLYRGKWPDVRVGVTDAVHGIVAGNLSELLIVGLILLIELAMTVVIPFLLLSVLLRLRTSSGVVAASTARFVRITFYTGIVSLGVVLATDHASLPAWCRGVVSPISMAAVVLPIGTGIFLCFSGAVSRFFGPSFHLQIGDANLCAFSRDAAVAIVAMLAALVLVMVLSAIPSLKLFGSRFLITSEWRPNTLVGKVKLDEQGNATIDPDTGETARYPDVPPSFVRCRSSMGRPRVRRWHCCSRSP